MRFDIRTVCITTAVYLIISLTVTSYAFADDLKQSSEMVTTPVTTPTPTPALSSPSATPSIDPSITPSTIPSGSPATDVTPAPSVTPTPSITPTPSVTPTPKPTDDESLWYRKQIPMTKAHQKLLWDYCKKRKLDYIDMLSLVYLESGFNARSSNGRYKGYFQISSKNTANIAKTLKIANKPLDGAININMGTALYSWILQDKRVKNLKQEKKRDVALLIFQRGTGGYDKSGISSRFLKKFYKKRSVVCSYFQEG